MMRSLQFLFFLLASAQASDRWTPERAKVWFQQQPWRAGVNFLPSTASNQFEMFQEENFDEATLARELGWAHDLGFNLARVFLHDRLYEQDGEAFLQRVDKYLDIANARGIGTMLVLFDGCWDPVPKPGVQPEPMPRVHNSVWAQAPGKEVLANLPAHEDRLRGYVQAVIGRFANDSRVVLWDIFNEPDNGNTNSFGYSDKRVPVAAAVKGTELLPMDKAVGARSLLQKAYSWAREVAPSQPLTAGIYFADTGEAEADSYRHETHAWMLDTADVLSFHNYDTLQGMSATAADLQRGRPLICSEYMARGAGSTFDPILGFLKDQDIWAVSWGFVNGRSQTIYPWDSWQNVYTDEPKPWHHDVIRKDGAPFLDSEAAYIRKVTGPSTFVV